MQPCRSVLLVLTGAFLLAGPAFSAEYVFAAENGEKIPWDVGNWAIVVAEDAIPSEQYAASELQAVLEQATGTVLPIQSTSSTAGTIFVGAGEEMAASPVGFRVDDLGEEGLRIRCTPTSIAIAGGRPRGTLYGVYEFLERHLGVRFLTFDHTHIPSEQEPISIPCGEFSYTPPFSFRWSYYKENSDHPEFAARLRVNTVTHDEKLGGVTPQSLINHSFHRYLNVSQYGAEHPEYFALVDGERKLNAGGGGPELCVTNPDVIRIVSEGVLEDLRANPTRRNISVSQNDNDAYCRCENCEALNVKEGTPMGSNLYLVNAVADAVATEFPDTKVGTLSYWYTRKPPATMKPRDNVQIQLCSIECCVVYPLDDPSIEKNQEFCADMQAWGEICDDIWVWHYNTNFASYDLPFANLRAIGQNVKFFARNNVHGVFMQANGNGNSGEFCDLRNYVMSHCLWDASLDSWDLVEEFCRLHYAEASGPILEYLTFIHDVAVAADAEPGCFGIPEEFGLTREVSQKALAFFDAALAATDDPDVQARVEKASICAYRAMIETGSAYTYADGRARLVFPEGYGHVPGRYIDLCGRHNMTQATERQRAADYIAQLKRVTGEGVPAARIENDTWRLTFFPERNGRLVDAHHKPSGRDLLATWPRAGLRECGGTFEEVGELGFDGAPGTYEAKVKADAVTLTMTLPDGSTFERKIALNGERVRFESVITHTGDEARTYQVKVRPEFDVVSTSKDSRVIAAYVGDAAGWRQFNEDWEQDHGPGVNLLESPEVDRLAFFNHEAGFGVAGVYDPDTIERPRLWHNADRHQLNLELFTKRVELNKGELSRHSYSLEYLDKPPALRITSESPLANSR
jgi:hypothetical protein